MRTKTLTAALLAAALAVPVLYAADDAKQNAKKCPDCTCKECKCAMHKLPPPDGGKDMKNRPPRPGRASKETKDAVMAYKANPTEENKAKLKAQLEADYDAAVKKQEDRIAEMKAKKADIINNRLTRLTTDSKGRKHSKQKYRKDLFSEKKPPGSVPESHHRQDFRRFFVICFRAIEKA